jgi:hypothetical protein
VNIQALPLLISELVDGWSASCHGRFTPGKEVLVHIENGLREPQLHMQFVYPCIHFTFASEPFWYLHVSISYVLQSRSGKYLRVSISHLLQSHSGISMFPFHTCFRAVLVSISVFAFHTCLRTSAPRDINFVCELARRMPHSNSASLHKKRRLKYQRIL